VWENSRTSGSIYCTRFQLRLLTQPGSGQPQGRPPPQQTFPGRTPNHASCAGRCF
jgi:hypothetical protein